MAKELAYKVSVEFKVPADQPQQAHELLTELAKFGTVTIIKANAAKGE
jgi:hypothetical protein